MASTLIALTEYLATSYDPDREYVDGVIEERNVGEYDHARLQIILAAWFLKQEQAWNIRVVVEQRIQVSATRFRIPDITVMDRKQPIEQIVTRPPLAVIEVLSPLDTWRRVEEKVTDYLDFSIPHIWILDPAQRKAWVALRGAFQQTSVLEAAGSGIRIPLDELFQQL